MYLLDDPTKPVPGADYKKIVNFLVPSKNIHPGKKPAGLAPVIEILYEHNLFDPSLFPNSGVATVFDGYAGKPTAYRKRIQAISKQIKLARSMQQSLSYGGVNWQPFA